MPIIKESIQIFSSDIEIFVEKLTAMPMSKIKYRHSVYIACKDLNKITNMHHKLFDTKNGRFIQNELGKKLGATISASSFTIKLNPKRLKDVINELGISTVRYIQY